MSSRDDEGSEDGVPGPGGSDDDATTTVAPPARRPSLADRLRLGTTLGRPDPEFDRRYSRAETLGRGGMGEVVLVRDQRARRSVAMKTLHPKRTDSERARLRFLKEAQFQAGLEHPAILPVYDLGIDPRGNLFFTMKRVRGDSLSQILRRLREGDAAAERAYPRQRLLAGLLRACMALDYAHHQGILHRDLKPANLMFGPWGEVYVVDWGLARRVDEADDPSTFGEWAREHGEDSGEDFRDERATRPGSSIGTLGYAPPEQLRGGTDALGPEADVWSLGAILFEVLTLERFVPGRGFRELLAATFEERDRRPSSRRPDLDVPPELDAICERALRPDPAERCPSAREMHDAIQAHLDGQRDSTLRSELSRQHAAEASRLASQALAGGAEPTALADRADALRELGRALALDPDNDHAVTTFHRLVTEPPTEPPPEVIADIEDEEREGYRLAAFLYGYGSALGLLLMIYTYARSGVISWAPTLGSLVAGALAAGIPIHAAHTGRHRGRTWQYGFLAAAIVNFWCMGRAAGPLVTVPSMFVGLGVVTALVPSRTDRRNFLLMIVAGLILPVLLEHVGVLAPSYVFEGDRIVIPTRLIAGSPGPATLAMLGAPLFFLIWANLSVGWYRQQLSKEVRERKVLVWQLGQFGQLGGAGRPDVRTGEPEPAT